MSFWWLQFPPKTEEKQSHSSKIEFVRSFFGGNVGLKKSFFLTFRDTSPRDSCIMTFGIYELFSFSIWYLIITKYVITSYSWWSSIVTHTIRTLVSVGTGPTTVTSIINTIGIIGFIIAMAISNQLCIITI